MKNTHHCETWQRDAVAVAVASCFVLSNPLYANPIGPNVVNGVVSIAQQANSLNITNSPGAIIHWQSFSIGVSEATRFIQQSAASSVLNRVTGVDPSSILGALQSNGRVFLINPNGVLFGAGAQVDVAGLVVSTLNLSNADFLNGRYNFTANAGAGGISNQGNLTALPGGQIYLVAPNISNSGMITSANGDIILAAGNSVELVNANSPDVRVVIDAPSNEVLNLGSIVANSGRVGIYAGLINHHGIVSADTATVDATGKVVFMANKDINLEPGSVVSASGTAGGVHDGGEVRIIADGTLAMRQGAQVHVDGGVDGGNGGFLELSGKGGFTLRGAYTGRAQKTGYRNGSLLLDPMNIDISSGGSTLSSSGTGNYNFAANVGSASSTAVIDPNMSGLTGWSAVNLTAGRDITVSSPIYDSYMAFGVALKLTADRNITVAANIGSSTSEPFNHDLTLTAGNNININSSIYLGSNNLTATAGANITANAVTIDTLAPATGAAVTLNADSLANGAGNIQIVNSSIITNGGNIVMGGGLDPTTTAAVGSGIAGNDLYGIYLSGTTLDAGTGNISLLGTGITGTIGADGIYITDVSVLQTTSGAITLVGTGGAGSVSNNGVRLGTDASVSTVDGAISISGNGAGSGASNYGLYIHNGATVAATGAGTIDLRGTGGAGTTDNYGVYISATVGSTAISVVDGILSITGQGGVGTDSWNVGVYLRNDATVTSTGFGAITLDGTGGAGTSNNYGVRLSSGMQITSLDGDILINGQGAGSGASNYGIIHTNTSGAITSTGLANITLNGTGAGTAEGISLAGVITANHDLTLQGSGLLLPASIYTIAAGNDLNLKANIGTSDARFNHDLTLTGGNNVNINASVYQGNNTLTLAANADGIGGGDVVISPPNTFWTATSIVVDTQGGLNVSGVGLQVLGHTPPCDCWFYDAPVTVNVGGNFTANLTGAMLVEAGSARDPWDNSVRVNANGNIVISALSLTVRGGNASASGSDEGGINAAHADATLHGNNVTLTLGSGGLTVQGGTASASESSANGWAGSSNGGALDVIATANAELSATGSVTINSAGSVTVRGGSADASASSNTNGYPGSATANADALLSAGMTLTISNAAGMTVQGGGASASASDSGVNSATATANATVQAGSMDITLTGPLLVQGGNGASADASWGSSESLTSNTAIADASALVHASGNVILTVTAGDVTIAGGDSTSASGSEGYGVQQAQASANAELSAGGDLNLTVSNGNLSVRGGNSASASVSASSNYAQLTAMADANAKLAAGNNLTLDVNGSITVAGGNNASASASGMGASNLNTATAHADALLSAGGLLTMNADSLTIQGGNSAYASASDSGVNTATATANATVQAGSMGITLTESLLVQGGSNAYAEASCRSDCVRSTATANADALLSATGALTMNAGSLTIQGGNSANASASDIGSNTATATANATVQAGSMDITLSGPLLVQGGSHASASAGAGGHSSSTWNGTSWVYAFVPNPSALGRATAQADALLDASGVLTIHQTSGLTVQAGDGVGAMTSNSGDNTATASANATVSGGTVNITTSGALQVRGGTGFYTSSGTTGSPGSPGYPWSSSGTARASADGTNSMVLTNANGLLVSTGALTVQAGSLTLQGGSAQATGSGGSALQFGNALANAGAGISVVGDATITVTAGDMLLGGGTATANGTATADASATLAVGGIKTLNLPAGSLLINGGNVYGTGGKAAQAVFDPGAINATVGGDILLTGGNALGAEAMMYSLGPTNLTVGGATGISLSGGAGSGILPSYNTSTSPITITFTGGGMVQPFVITQGMADVMIQSLYVVPPVIVPPVVVPPSVPTGDLLQQALNSVLDGALETGALPILNGPLLAAVEQSGEEENPLEKKPTYTCQ